MPNKPFIAFHCLERIAPRYYRAPAPSHSASVLLSQGRARAELASGILAWRQRAENGSQLEGL